MLTFRHRSRAVKRGFGKNISLPGYIKRYVLFGCMILGSARSISETRKCLLPLFPQKGYSICRLLYQKFCSLTTFPEKIVILYLVNDLVATGRKTYPGTLLSISPTLRPLRLHQKLPRSDAGRHRSRALLPPREAPPASGPLGRASPVRFEPRSSLVFLPPPSSDSAKSPLLPRFLRLFRPLRHLDRHH